MCTSLITLKRKWCENDENGDWRWLKTLWVRCVQFPLIPLVLICRVPFGSLWFVKEWKRKCWHLKGVSGFVASVRKIHWTHRLPRFASIARCLASLFQLSLPSSNCSTTCGQDQDRPLGQKVVQHSCCFWQCLAWSKCVFWSRPTASYGRSLGMCYVRSMGCLMEFPGKQRIAVRRKGPKELNVVVPIGPDTKVVTVVAHVCFLGKLCFFVLGCLLHSDFGNHPTGGRRLDIKLNMKMGALPLCFCNCRGVNRMFCKSLCRKRSAVCITFCRCQEYEKFAFWRRQFLDGRYDFFQFVSCLKGILRSSFQAFKRVEKWSLLKFFCAPFWWLGTWTWTDEVFHWAKACGEH